jgi:hypothetical protein
MSSNLTTYDAKLVKTKSDSSMNLSPSASNTEITRSFKRSQRSRHANNPIVSRNPEISPLKDCQEHYERLYACPEEPPAINRTNDLEFSIHFTEALIKDRIKKYPNPKSMGLDQIHTLVLKSLTSSHFFLRSVMNLFQIFAATGVCPSSFSVCRLHLLLKNENEPVASKHV